MLKNKSGINKKNKAIMHFETLGPAHGHPIIILHGLFGSHRNWLSIARELKNDYQLILPDWRNHGESFHSDQHDIPELAADLARLIHQLRLKSYSLIGHSMGGLAAMHLCLSHAQQEFKNIPSPRELVVVDIIPRAYKRDYSTEIAALQLDVSQFNTREQIDLAMSKIIDDKLLRGFLQMNLKRSASGFSWQLNVAPLARDYKSGISTNFPANQFLNPVLLLYGDKSNFVDPSSDFKIMDQYFPNLKTIAIKNGSHWLHYSHPTQFSEEIRGFISKTN